MDEWNGMMMGERKTCREKGNEERGRSQVYTHAQNID